MLNQIDDYITKQIKCAPKKMQHFLAMLKIMGFENKGKTERMFILVRNEQHVFNQEIVHVYNKHTVSYFKMAREKFFNENYTDALRLINKYELE